MTPGSRRKHKTAPPGDTGHEAAYLHFLSEKRVPVTVQLRDGERVHGWIEYFDHAMIRLTREGSPNLFIYKHQIRTISEQKKHQVRELAPPPVKKSGRRTQTGALNGAEE